ncbi:putative monovalent cation/H+ antiporter subunit A [Metarhizobium album]|uniref:Putative monovalent cation/H+ antiporter subunit A n=1 Tax=Metarhizobium album TaxID=2182425 RepID=A0A2U2DY62_9HYPH|nr:putative monovalent cation/H+ antiporter subunit A [Rhizobium album]PWE58149.1 putative monovalent cation/H+ antiporter subunit A [Rhizobium album]
MIAGAADLTFLALSLPFVAACLAPVLFRLFGHRAAWLLALAPAVSFLHLAGFIAEVARGETVTGGYAWVPSYNLSFSWYIDGLALVFGLLITGIGVLVVLYAGGYLKGHPQQGRFFSFLMMFMGAMLGLVVSDSFLMLFVFWELTSITSFLLIGFDHERPAARRAALQALLVTGGGGLFLLAGLLMIWNIADVTQMSLLLSYGEVVKASPYYLAALLLVLVGAFTKSAQFPFHVWLPNAMEAPTPVSAYLHSATMVKAGVYLLMRLYPAMGGTPVWEILLPVFGGGTLLTGALMALRQTDLKLMLAYTTVASLGLLVLLVGFGSPYAIEAAVLYLVGHSLFKGALFMVAGAIDHGTGTRDLTRLGGLRRAMPVTFAAALLAALSMAGLPPFFGFLAKEEIYLALAAGNLRSILFTIVAVAGNALMFAAAFAVALKPFLGESRQTLKHPHEAPALMWIGPLVLALAGLAAALVSTAFHAAISSPMASAVRGEATAIAVGPMPHVGLPLALSAATILLGLAAYRLLDRLRDALARFFQALGPGPDQGFDEVLEALVACAVKVTRFVQPGRLDIYLSVTFAAVAAVLLLPLFLWGEAPSEPAFAWPSLSELAMLLIAVIGLAAVLVAVDRLTAIVALGIQGFAVAVLFLLFGAPDLAFTQFMIETLSVVILALVMTRLRLHASDRRPAGQRLADGAVALGCGLGLTLLLLKATEGVFDTALGDFFGSYSKVIAHGANVVNVIIVDFRGTDTLGEIAVVLAAGMAILALIRLGKTQKQSGK